MPDVTVFWVDQLVGSQSSEVPAQLLNEFSIRVVQSVEQLERMMMEIRPAGAFFDFDYPDRRRLQAFERFKSKNPSVPVVLVTLQHSESLAVWAFRHGALDYLVKPIPEHELENCISRVTAIERSRLNARDRRRIDFAKPPIPAAIPNAPSGKKERLAPAIFFVQQNYSQRISSDSMARICGMSPSHFSRAFKKQYDLTFQEFLLRYRVFQACTFLNVSAASIADVAYSVGFSDPSYFTRVFKRYIGVAPSEFVAANDDTVRQLPEQEMTIEGDASTSQVVRTLSTSFGA
jgi:AraC-like DNA-binding protein